MYEPLEEYYKNSYEMLVKTYAKAAGSPENAEDVVQEAFARAMQYWETYNPDRGMISTWFRMILINSLRDFKREELNRGFAVEIEHADEEVFGEDKHLEQNLYDAIIKEIHTFSPAQSRILDLAFVHHYTPRDIARIVDSTTIGNIWWTISEFRRRIKDKFGEGVYE